MRSLLLIPIVLILLPATACDPLRRQHHLANISSGYMGCSPADITVSEDDGRTWVATCKGRTFRCSGYGGSAYAPPSTHCAEDKEATASATAESATAPAEPMTVHIAAARFTLPGGFRADPYKGHKTFHSASGWDRFVYLDVESYASGAAEYAAEKFADAKVKNVKVNGIVVPVATRSEQHFKKSMRVATAVTIVAGEAYALTCAATADDDDEQDIPSFCVTTLKSLRIDKAE